MMDKERLKILEQDFYRYVRAHYHDDPYIQKHVLLKEEHTKRVCEIAALLASELEMDEFTASITGAAALLHDAGRFQQFHRYRTFNDSRSLDHGKLGQEIVESQGWLLMLPEKEQQAVIQAVGWHNKRNIPLEAEGWGLLCTQVVRDADKLDIFAMIVSEDSRMQIPDLPKKGEERPCSAKVTEQVLQGMMPKTKDLEGPTDLLLFRMSWLYDIVFPCSFRYVRRTGLFQKMIELLPEDPATQEAARCLQSYLHCRCGNNGEKVG